MAHMLARKAFILKSSCIWGDDPSNLILSSLMNDVILFSDQ